MFTQSVYINRRNNLKSNGLKGVGLLLGNTESPMNYAANTYKFRQDSTFLYFFGLNLSNLAGVIDFDSGEEYIFGDDVEIDDIIWMGPQPTMKELAGQVGVNKVLPFSNLYEYISKQLNLKREIHFLPPYRAENKILLNELLGISIKELKTKSSVELVRAVVSLRSIKSDEEIAEMEIAAEIGYKMHMCVFKMAKPGIKEQEIAGMMDGISYQYGEGPSFPTILSVHGETLHNPYHNNIMQSGQLLLADAGAQANSFYASDYTRVTPVSGKFTQKQKEIYEIVRRANQNTIEMSAPGQKYLDIHLAAAKVIASGLIDLGLMKGNPDEAVDKGAHTLFFVHGLGHMLGLDVHDMENLGENYVGYDNELNRSTEFGTGSLRFARTLKPGMIVTDEPGIYFIPALIEKWKAENKSSEFINYNQVEKYLDFGGIRLEDDLLITDNGCRLIGKRLPITIDEVENAMKA
ncbi:MAG: aminopeptidase P family protein [Bacteroidales bacterium]|jgi:Xaa-Pro aminopeptidase|nr:aminopeptidase P family protein [Bacteroidales bacterium]